MYACLHLHSCRALPASSYGTHIVYIHTATAQTLSYVADSAHHHAEHPLKLWEACEEEVSQSWLLRVSWLGVGWELAGS